MPTIVYLHGFNSSPQSHKIGQMRQWLQQHRPDIRLIAPYIAMNAARVAEVIAEQMALYPDANLVGSSLGGYYATWASAVFGRKAVLINPAVEPYRRFRHYINTEQQNLYTGEKYILTPEMVAELEPLDVGALAQPSRLWVLLQTGDETLDYRHAAERYAASPQLVEQGGDHAFSTFEQHIPAIIHFLSH